MAISIGNLNISDIYNGNNRIKKIYNANNLIYEFQEQQSTDNLLVLSEDNSSWQSWDNDEGLITFNADNTLTLNITGASSWGLNIYQPNLILESGKTYKLSCNNIGKSTWISINSDDSMMIHRDLKTIEFTVSDNVINPNLIIWANSGVVYDNVLWNIVLEEVTSIEINYFDTANKVYEESITSYQVLSSNSYTASANSASSAYVTFEIPGLTANTNYQLTYDVENTNSNFNKWYFITDSNDNDVLLNSDDGSTFNTGTNTKVHARIAVVDGSDVTENTCTYTNIKMTEV